MQSDAWHTAMLSRDRILGQLEASLRSGVDAVGGVDTPAGRRLRLSVEFLDFVAQHQEDLRRGWERRKAEITRDWPRNPPTQPDREGTSPSLPAQRHTVHPSDPPRDIGNVRR